MIRKPISLLLLLCILLPMAACTHNHNNEEVSGNADTTEASESESSFDSDNGGEASKQISVLLFARFASEVEALSKNTPTEPDIPKGGFQYDDGTDKKLSWVEVGEGRMMLAYKNTSDIDFLSGKLYENESKDLEVTVYDQTKSAFMISIPEGVSAVLAEYESDIVTEQGIMDTAVSYLSRYVSDIDLDHFDMHTVYTDVTDYGEDTVNVYTKDGIDTSLEKNDNRDISYRIILTHTSNGIKTPDTVCILTDADGNITTVKYIKLGVEWEKALPKGNIGEAVRAFIEDNKRWSFDSVKTTLRYVSIKGEARLLCDVEAECTDFYSQKRGVRFTLSLY